MRRAAAPLAVALVVALVVALGGAASAANPVRASSTVDRRTITIGDPIRLTLVVDAEPGYRVTDPGVGRAIGDFEVLETLSALQERRPSGVVRVTFRYRITSFAVGDRTLPAIEVAYAGPDGRREVTRTLDQPITVESVIAPGEDAGDIKPLLPQLSVPGGVLWALARTTSVAAGAITLVVAALATTLALRRRARTRPAVEDDVLTPVQRALGELERIAARRLPEQGRYEEYYELIARVLRRYVRERYGLPALERTPRELRAELERAGVDRAQVAMIGEILGEGDAVRFRHLVPYPAHAQQAVRHALEVMRKAAAAEQYEMAPLQVR